MNLNEGLAFYRSMMGGNETERFAEFKAMSLEDREEVLLHMIQHLTRGLQHVMAALQVNVGHNLEDGAPQRDLDS